MFRVDFKSQFYCFTSNPGGYPSNHFSECRLNKWLSSSGAPLFDNIKKVARGVLHGCIGECCSRKYPSIFTRIDDEIVWNFIYGLNETSLTNIGK